MTPDVTGVLVRLDPAKVRAAYERWQKIMPFIPDECDPAISFAFDDDMRALRKAVEDAE
jgi:hypothetical protein